MIYGIGSDITSAKNFTLMDSMSNIIWEKSKFGGSHILITNEGTLIKVVTHGAAGPVSFAFYDTQGNLIKQTQRMTHFHYTLSPDGNYFLINSMQDGLLAFNSKGELIKNYGLCINFAVSPELKTVVAYDKEELRFYRNGKLIGKKSIKGLTYSTYYGKRMVISSDEQFVAIVAPKKLYFFDINKAQILWEVESEPNSRFESVDLYPNAEKVVAGVCFLNDAKLRKAVYGYIYIYDQKGLKLAEHRIDYPEDPKILSVEQKVDISEDGKYISVNTDFDIFKFKLE